MTILEAEQYSIAKFTTALMEAIPLLTEHWPEGMIDFRGGTPMAWRGGLFSMAGTSLEGASLEALTGGNSLDAVNFKALFGSEVACGLAAHQVRQILDHSCLRSPRFESSRISQLRSFWVLTFSLPLRCLAELAAAITPAPRRPQDAYSYRVPLHWGDTQAHAPRCDGNGELLQDQMPDHLL
jgi:hypothetical protein